MADRETIYNQARDRILGALDQGIVPWRSPYLTPSLPFNVTSGREYSGVNVPLLWCTSVVSGFQSAAFLTFNQARELGGSVRKGEKGSWIVYVGTAKDKRPREDRGKDQDQAAADPRYTFLKYSYVFNVAQCDGLPARVLAKAEPSGVAADPGVADDLAASWSAVGGPRVLDTSLPPSAYSPALDMVKRAPCKGDTERAAVLLHELIHATGHTSRLARPGFAELQAGRSESAESYAAEELVAELGSAFLAAVLGVPGADSYSVNQAAYCAMWSGRLKAAPAELIVKQAAAASRAANYILGAVAAAAVPGAAVAA